MALSKLTERICTCYVMAVTLKDRDIKFKEELLNLVDELHDAINSDELSKVKCDELLKGIESLTDKLGRRDVNDLLIELDKTTGVVNELADVFNSDDSIIKRELMT